MDPTLHHRFMRPLSLPWQLLQASTSRSIGSQSKPEDLLPGIRRARCKALFINLPWQTRTRNGSRLRLENMTAKVPEGLYRVEAFGCLDRILAFVQCLSLHPAEVLRPLLKSAKLSENNSNQTDAQETSGSPSLLSARCLLQFSPPCLGLLCVAEMAMATIIALEAACASGFVVSDDVQKSFNLNIYVYIYIIIYGILFFSSSGQSSSESPPGFKAKPMQG